jgi:hypothetical protein
MRRQTDRQAARSRTPTPPTTYARPASTLAVDSLIPTYIDLAMCDRPRRQNASWPPTWPPHHPRYSYDLIKAARHRPPAPAPAPPPRSVPGPATPPRAPLPSAAPPAHSVQACGPPGHRATGPACAYARGPPDFLGKERSLCFTPSPGQSRQRPGRAVLPAWSALGDGGRVAGVVAVTEQTTLKPRGRARDVHVDQRSAHRADDLVDRSA